MDEKPKAGQEYDPSVAVIAAILQERARQQGLYGDQDYPLTPSFPYPREKAEAAKELCDRAFAEGRGTWSHLLQEALTQMGAAMNEKAEVWQLIRIAAIALAALESIDRQRAVLSRGNPTTDDLAEKFLQEGPQGSPLMVGDSLVALYRSYREAGLSIGGAIDCALKRAAGEYRPLLHFWGRDSQVCE